PGQNVNPPEADEEIVYFEGTPIVRGDMGRVILLGLAGLVLLALPVLAWVLEWGWPWWVGLISILVAIALLILPWAVVKTTRYRISNYRIDFERGLLSKTIDTLELWHVDDIRYRQSLLDRMLRVGTI